MRVSKDKALFMLSKIREEFCVKSIESHEDFQWYWQMAKSKREGVKIC